MKMTRELADEILELSKSHGFEVEAVYGDGTTEKEYAVTLYELGMILTEILLNT